MSTDHLFINSVQLNNFLSFGPASKALELGPLNVLIGKNSCGKSNLIEAFAILRAAPKNLLAPVRQGGGVREWLWKGADEPPTAEINVSLTHPADSIPLIYKLSFTEVSQRLELVDETIECPRKTKSRPEDVDFFYRYQKGAPVLRVRNFDPVRKDAPRGVERTLQREDFDINQSVLSQRKDPEQYPELTYIGDRFSKIKLYRDWNLGRYSPSRVPQRPDLPEDYLLENMSNLGLVLNDLQHRPKIKKTIIEKLNLFYDEFDDITTKIQGGSIQIYLHEKNLNQPVPASRLSDGTLRFLSLLVILCHPDQPPLICIEEPELGLHPDILPYLARLLVETAKKTQLIVTTHSDILVDELSENPDSVIVCEKENGSTMMNRLDAKSLEAWLENY